MTNKFLEEVEKEPHRGQSLVQMLKDCLGAVIYLIETLLSITTFLIKQVKPLVLNLFYLIDRIIDFIIRIIVLSIEAVKVGAERITGALLHLFLSIINFGTAWFKHRTPTAPVEKAGQGSVAKSLQKTGGPSRGWSVPDRGAYSLTTTNEDPNLSDDIDCADALVPEVERLVRDIERMIRKEVVQSVDKARKCAEWAVSGSPAHIRDDLGVYDLFRVYLRYQGEVRKDTGGLDASGYGCLFSGEIPIYLGQFVSGLYNGYGVLSQDGERYEGQFRDNRYHGKGRLISATDEYVGEFKDGKKHGRGILTFKSPSGDIRTHTGYFSDGKMTGYGVRDMHSGQKCRGLFNQDTPVMLRSRCD